MIPINESALQFVSSPYVQNLVTKESCIAYIQSTASWNTYMKILSAVAVGLAFYYMYRQGRFNKEKEALSKVISDGTGDNDDHIDSHDKPAISGCVRETTGDIEGADQH